MSAAALAAGYAIRRAGACLLRRDGFDLGVRYRSMHLGKTVPRTSGRNVVRQATRAPAHSSYVQQSRLLQLHHPAGSGSGSPRIGFGRPATTRILLPPQLCL